MRLILVVLALASFLGAQEPTSKPSPAIEANNEAVELLEKRDFEGAIKKFRKAMDLLKLAKKSPDPIITANFVTALLGQSSALMAKKDFIGADQVILEAKRTDSKNATITAYEGILAFRKGYHAQGLSFLQDAIAKDPKLALAHEFIGMIEYKAERLPKAIAAWEKAITLEAARKKHLGPLIQKAKRETAVESSMQTLRSTHFTCKFGDVQNRSVANEVLKMLEDAYAKVGTEFRVYPKEQLTAVLYADREFRGATNAQSWAAGIFDGKIRVPIRNFSRSQQSIRATLIHEYTHFVVSKLCRRVPSWLNEGLAQRMENADPKNELLFLRAAKEKGALKKMKLLSVSFARMSNASAVRLAYSQSLSFVGYLEDQYGMTRLVDVLRRMGQGQTVGQALYQVMGRDLDELERRWIDLL